MKVRKIAFATALSVGALVIGVCVIEGAATLATGRSLVRDRLFPESVRTRMRIDERLRAGRLTKGPFAVPTDPWVGIRMKGGVTIPFHGVDASTDALGLRTRVGPKPEPGARRIVVLGDSVAFGYGVADDETLAHHLESFLDGVRAPSTPRPIVRTVACPGWTFDNARRFLLDRIDAIAPDVVVFVPVGNDLDDAFSVLESGYRNGDLDAAAGAARPRGSLQGHHELALGLARRRALGWLARTATPPQPHALASGVTPESTRRFAALVDGVVDLDRRLGAAGIRFGIAYSTADAFACRLAARLADRAPTVPTTGLFGGLTRKHRLDGDPHWRPWVNREGGLRLARFLVDRGWFAAAEPLPAGDPRFASNDFSQALARLTAVMDAWDRGLVDGIGPAIDLTDGRGFHQVYGGVDADGTVGRGVHVVLRAPRAERIELRVRSLADARALFPVALAVTINGVAAPTVEITGPGEETTLSIPLPDAVRGAPFLEVLVRPSNWVVRPIDDVDRLVAFHLRSVRATPEE